MEDLLRFDFKKKYLDFDFETDGLNLIKTRPWQLSWLTATGKKIEDKQNRFLYWPDLKVSKGAAKITGFDVKYYETSGVKRKKYKVHGKIYNAEEPSKVIEDFEKLLYDDSYTVVGQNLLGFDVYIHNVVRLLLGLKTDYSYIPRVIDTKSLSASYIKETPLNRGDITAWQYKLLNFHKRGFKTNQGFMLDKFNIEHDKAKLHDSLYDIEMNFKLFWKLINSIDI